MNKVNHYYIVTTIILSINHRFTKENDAILDPLVGGKTVTTVVSIKKKRSYREVR